jgi:hypothetical protein
MAAVMTSINIDESISLAQAFDLSDGVQNGAVMAVVVEHADLGGGSGLQPVSRATVDFKTVDNRTHATVSNMLRSVRIKRSA